MLVRRAALLPNDQLSIANYKYRVHLGPDELPVAVPVHEHTQQLDANEVANLLRQAKQRPLEDSDPDVPALPLRPNPLPDVYPEDSP